MAIRSRGVAKAKKAPRQCVSIRAVYSDGDRVYIEQHNGRPTIVIDDGGWGVKDAFTALQDAAQTAMDDEKAWKVMA